MATRSVVAPSAATSVSGAVLERVCVPERGRRKGTPIVELERGGLRPDQLQTRIREHRDLIVAVLADVDVHQLRELGDSLVALILQRRRGGVLRRRRRQLLVDLRDRLHGRIGLRNPGGDTLLGLAAQRLNAAAHGIEVLRQLLRRAERRGLRCVGRRTGRKRLQRGREIVEGRVEGTSRSWRPVDLLKLLIELRLGVRIGTAGSLGLELTLHHGVEVAVDPLDIDAGPGIATGRDLNLIDGLVDIARRIGIGDVAGNDRQACLGRIQTRQRGVEGLGEAHASGRLPASSIAA